jgi:pilus assembly protein CpaB
MSSALRLSIIAVLALATAAFGLIAYNMRASTQVPIAAAVVKAPVAAAAVGYFVAVRPLPKGTLLRDEDFTARQVSPDSVPAEAMLDTPDSKASLPGSLVRKFIDVGKPVTLQDILRPRDRGFLASVLAPDSRAISIKVNEESGVSGLIRPGDHVDVVLTQVLGKSDPTSRAVSETVLRNVRVIAIDQELAEGGRAGDSTASGKVVQTKLPQTVSLELTPEQVKKITVAKQLGMLSLAVRAAVEDSNGADSGVVSSCDVSPELARENAIAGQRTAVVIHTGSEVKQYMVRRQDAEGAGCQGALDVTHQTATAMNSSGNTPRK